VRGHGVDGRLAQARAALAVVRGPGGLLRGVAHRPRRALEHRVGVGVAAQPADEGAAELLRRERHARVPLEGRLHQRRPARRRDRRGGVLAKQPWNCLAERRSKGTTSAADALASDGLQGAQIHLQDRHRADEPRALPRLQAAYRQGRHSHRRHGIRVARQGNDALALLLLHRRALFRRRTQCLRHGPPRARRAWRRRRRARSRLRQAILRGRSS